MAKYEALAYEKGPELSDFLLWEGDAWHSREEWAITSAKDIPHGTILEDTDGTVAVASAGTGRLGMLVHHISGREGSQPAVVIVRDACFSRERLLVDGGIKTAAITTLESQNIKVSS